MKSDGTGIVILSHGSKIKKANASLERIVRAAKRETGIDAIVPAYLQFCQPDLERSVKGLVAKGLRTIIIIPFFLFNGNHVTRDIPRIIGKAKERYPGVNFVYTKNIGDDARMACIVSDMITEAVSGDGA